MPRDGTEQTDPQEQLVGVDAVGHVTEAVVPVRRDLAREIKVRREQVACRVLVVGGGEEAAEEADDVHVHVLVVAARQAGLLARAEDTSEEELLDGAALPALVQVRVLK